METAFTVDRPAAEVFEYLADATNEAKWNPWARWVTKVSDGPVGQGSVFRGSYQGFGELEQDLSVYEPSTRLTYHAVPKGMREAKMTFELEPTDKGTRLRVVGEAKPAGILKLMEPLMALRMRPHLRDIADGIKRELQV